VDLIGQVVAWFTDPANWSGTAGVPNRLVEHVLLSLAAIITAIVIAVPVGLAIGHTGKGAFMTVSVANLGRSIPSYALLIIFVTWFGIGFAAAYPALFVLAIPPILTNTYVGLRQVDRDMLEAGRAMGMREDQLLRRVELPLAAPAIIAGVRIAAVQVVATATLAALVGGGALGRYIVDGFALRQQDMLVAGAVLVAGLALLTERTFTFLERRLVSPGLARTQNVEAEVLNLPNPQESGT
jgi:osmoprotectant transport system permease protein